MSYPMHLQSNRVTKYNTTSKEEFKQNYRNSLMIYLINIRDQDMAYGFRGYVDLAFADFYNNNNRIQYPLRTIVIYVM